jgi:hypothetical protein
MRFVLSGAWILMTLLVVGCATGSGDSDPLNCDTAPALVFEHKIHREMMEGAEPHFMDELYDYWALYDLCHPE